MARKVALRRNTPIMFLEAAEEEVVGFQKSSWSFHKLLCLWNSCMVYRTLYSACAVTGTHHFRNLFSCGSWNSKFWQELIHFFCSRLYRKDMLIKTWSNDQSRRDSHEHDMGNQFLGNQLLENQFLGNQFLGNQLLKNHSLENQFWENQLLENEIFLKTSFWKTSFSQIDFSPKLSFPKTLWKRQFWELNIFR